MFWVRVNGSPLRDTLKLPSRLRKRERLCSATLDPKPRSLFTSSGLWASGVIGPSLIEESRRQLRPGEMRLNGQERRSIIKSPGESLFMPRIHFLPRLDAKRKVVLARGDGARRELREDARPVVCLVEIENHDPPCIREIGVELAPHCIGLLSARFIAEHDEELFFVSSFEYGLQAILLAVHFEHECAGTGIVLRSSDHGCDGKYLGRFIGFEPGLDAPFRIGEKIFQSFEVQASRVFFVLHPYADLVPPLDHIKAERAERQNGRICDSFSVGMEYHGLHNRVPELYLHSGAGFEACDSMLKPDRSGALWGFTRGKDDCIR